MDITQRLKNVRICGLQLPEEPHWSARLEPDWQITLPSMKFINGNWLLRLPANAPQ